MLGCEAERGESRDTLASRPGSQCTQGCEKAAGIFPVGGSFTQLPGTPGCPTKLGA